MSTQPSELLRRRLPCDSSAPRLARHALHPLAAIEPVRDDALLVASELVSNAVRHSGCAPADEVEVEVELTPEGVLIAVTDPGRSGSAPAPRPEGAVRGGGLGLRIVEAVARRWGAERREGMRVWAEIALDAERAGRG
ncbi:MAG TPA: ATP-binding protein [Solirubrobacteraceae bacterium]